MGNNQNNKTVFEQTEKEIKGNGFSIIKKDWDRPWGGFFVIDESQAQQFANTYFNNIAVDDLKISGKLSPKILIVEPQKRLSWQYHHRRAEIWKVLEGPVGVITSDTNEEEPLQTVEAGKTITLNQGQRHRLVGLEAVGILAEIWQHTDADNPSDEDDIVRVQDDYGR